MDPALPVTPPAPILTPPLPGSAGAVQRWGQLYGSAASLALAAAAEHAQQPLLCICADVRSAEQLAVELAFLLDGTGLPVRGFPDWEALAYDAF